jgi:hypothetical protein
MSALDARIRRLAREEAEALAGGAPAAVLETTGPDRLTELEKEVADLRARLEKLENAPRRTATARKGTGE